jgi:hypothetical protein
VSWLDCFVEVDDDVFFARLSSPCWVASSEGDLDDAGEQVPLCIVLLWVAEGEVCRREQLGYGQRFSCVFEDWAALAGLWFGVFAACGRASTNPLHPIGCRIAVFLWLCSALDELVPFSFER